MNFKMKNMEKKHDNAAKLKSLFNTNVRYFYKDIEFFYKDIEFLNFNIAFYLGMGEDGL